MDERLGLKLSEGLKPLRIPPNQELASLWDNLTKFGQIKKLIPNQNVFQAGDPCKYIYIVVSGYVLLQKSEAILNIIEPGQSIGAALLGSKVSPQAYPISAKTLGHCELLELPWAEANKLFLNDYKILQYFMEQFRTRMDFIQSLQSMQEQSVAGRVAYFLVKKQNLLQTKLITRKIIAKSVNTSTETTIRTLSEFQKNHIIKCEEKIIYLLDQNYLINLYQGC